MYNDTHDERHHDRFKACLIGGAIGDALGLPYEGLTHFEEVTFNHPWLFSDDTLLTLATCEALATGGVDPSKVAESMLLWYNAGRLSGLGSSTLKALRELQVGGHWALVGRQGAFAAGNGAAMRIAPLAFKSGVDRFALKDVVNITHKNDEAYAGALALYTAISMATTDVWKGHDNLLSLVIAELPDTSVRDRLVLLNTRVERSILEVVEDFVPSGYVVDSVPMALFAASKVSSIGFEGVMKQLIMAGGDTDTNCSMAGQLMGAFGGMQVIPDQWRAQFASMKTAQLIDKIVMNWES